MQVRDTNTSRTPSFTKSGPGRFHIQGDGSHKQLTLKQRQAGAYGKGIRNWINAENAKRTSARLSKRMGAA